MKHFDLYGTTRKLFREYICIYIYIYRNMKSLEVSVHQNLDLAANVRGVCFPSGMLASAAAGSEVWRLM